MCLIIPMTAQFQLFEWFFLFSIINLSPPSNTFAYLANTLWQVVHLEGALKQVKTWTTTYWTILLFRFQATKDYCYEFFMSQLFVPSYIPLTNTLSAKCSFIYCSFPEFQFSHQRSETKLISYSQSITITTWNFEYFEIFMF